MTLTVEQAKRLHGINDSWHMAPDEENFLVRSTESLIREHGEDRVKHSDSRKSRTPQELHQPGHLQFSSRNGTAVVSPGLTLVEAVCFSLPVRALYGHVDHLLKSRSFINMTIGAQTFQSQQFDTGEQIPDTEA